MRWHEVLIVLDGVYFDGQIFTRKKKYTENRFRMVTLSRRYDAFV